MTEPHPTANAAAPHAPDPALVAMDPATTFRRLVPLARLAPAVTPAEDVFVLAHMGVARIDVARWRLTVDGLVERPLALDHATLMRLPARDVTAVLECFGNPRDPDVPTRRVANVVWRGVALADVLRMAGVRDGARHAWLEAPDHGSYANVANDHYVRDLPLARALEPDVVLAWAMNGVPLAPEHGFPLRAFVPGWFGANAVKWLTRVHVAAERPVHPFITLYSRRRTVDGRTVVEPVRGLDVHAVVVDPADGARLAPGRHVVQGWAWSARPVTRVELSVDGGRTWRDAALAARGEDHGWQAFSGEARIEAAGRAEVWCRATDGEGRTQTPTGRNRIHAVSVTVGAA